MNRLFIFFLIHILVLIGKLNAQDTTFHFNIKNQSDSIYYKFENAIFYNADRKDANGYALKSKFQPKQYLKSFYYLNSNILLAEVECFDVKNTNKKIKNRIYQVKNGVYKEWYSNGQLKVVTKYINDTIEGDYKVYYENGELKRHDIWKKSEFIEGKCFNEQGKPIDFFRYIELPQFIGGIPAMMAFISKETKYPKSANILGIQGIVRIKFKVDKEGFIKDPVIHESKEESLDEEALRVVKLMPKWKPGKFDGIITEFYFIIPINYKLQ